MEALKCTPVILSEQSASKDLPPSRTVLLNEEGARVREVLRLPSLALASLRMTSAFFDGLHAPYTFPPWGRSCGGKT